MKNADCYILDRMSEILEPFQDGDDDQFKKDYIEKLYNFCKNDKQVQRALIYSRNVEEVKVIYGGGR